MNYIDIIKKLIDRHLTISSAESITGGLIAKMITDVPGSSKVLSESFITYSNESKINVLGVDPQIIDTYGVVSKEVASAMSIGLMNLTGSNICVATTGNAGPTVCDDKPVGRVYIAITYDKNALDKTCGSRYKTDVIELNIDANDMANCHDTNEQDIAFYKREYIRNMTADRVFEELCKI